MPSTLTAFGDGEPISNPSPVTTLISLFGEPISNPSPGVNGSGNAFLHSSGDPEKVRVCPVTALVIVTSASSLIKERLFCHNSGEPENLITSPNVIGCVSVTSSIDPIDAAADVVDKNLVLQNVGDGEFGGGNAANTLSIRVWYSVVDTIAF